jgi:hypothetical protein
VVALHSCLLDGAIEALDLTIRPGVGGRDQPMFHPEGAANAGKAMTTRKSLMRLQSKP